MQNTFYLRYLPQETDVLPPLSPPGEGKHRASNPLARWLKLLTPKQQLLANLPGLPRPNDPGGGSQQSERTHGYQSNWWWSDGGYAGNHEVAGSSRWRSEEKSAPGKRESNPLEGSGVWKKRSVGKEEALWFISGKSGEGKSPLGLQKTWPTSRPQ
eukprot:740151-Pelagomonas_calceolata.AAC.4